MADEKKQGEVIALNMDRLKTVAELDRVIKYIDGFSLFKKMFVDGMGPHLKILSRFGTIYKYFVW